MANPKDLIDNTFSVVMVHNTGKKPATAQAWRPDRNSSVDCGYREKKGEREALPVVFEQSNLWVSPGIDSLQGDMDIEPDPRQDMRVEQVTDLHITPARITSAIFQGNPRVFSIWPSDI